LGKKASTAREKTAPLLGGGPSTEGWGGGDSGEKTTSKEKHVFNGENGCQIEKGCRKAWMPGVKMSYPPLEGKNAPFSRKKYRPLRGLPLAGRPP